MFNKKIFVFLYSFLLLQFQFFSPVFADTCKDFYKALEIQDTSSFDKVRAEAETLAGFLLEAIQVLPIPGQKFSIEGYIFTIEIVENKRIKTIKVTIPEQK